MKTVVSLFAVMVLCFALPAGTDIINVPTDQPTIQAGIDAAQDGDEVVVADGTYTGDGNRDIQFHPRAITVRSANGPESCIIDCQGSSPDPHRAFNMEYGLLLDVSIVIEGFTITNGYTDGHGGAIYWGSNPGPTIRDNIITGNTAKYDGGGIYVATDARDTIIENNIITNNTAQATDSFYFFDGGGGIYGDFRGACRIRGNTISGNMSYSMGGGLYISRYEPFFAIENNIFSENEATENGGGIYASNTDTYLLNNQFIDNIAYRGGGVYAGDSYRLANNYFRGNIALSDGGGMRLYRAVSMSGNEFINNRSDRYGGGLRLVVTVTDGISSNIFVGNIAAERGGGCTAGYPDYVCDFTNNLFAENQANTGGGVCVQHSGDVTFRNCTFAANHAPFSGGGISCIDDSDTVISNSIIAFNTAGQNGPNLYIADTLAPSTITASHTDVLGGYASIFVGGGDCELILGAGMFDEDPLFVSGPEGDYGLSQVAAGQFVDSPCVDAGDDLTTATCYVGHSGTPICLNDFFTRNDGVPDTGTADLGYHRLDISNTVSAGLSCTPSSGILPFASQFTVGVLNMYTGQARRILYQLDVTLANDLYFPNWHRGWQNIQADQSFIRWWWQTIPALGSLTGENEFLLTVADVTPAPYNQPPYPPAGDTDTAVCTVTGY